MYPACTYKSTDIITICIVKSLSLSGFYGKITMTTIQRKVTACVRGRESFSNRLRFCDSMGENESGRKEARRRRRRRRGMRQG